jgi:integrase
LGRHRKTRLTLALSRIYLRHRKFAYFSSEPLINPTTGRATKWHVLGPVADGELRARMALDALLKRQSPGHGTGNFGPAFDKWRKYMLQKRDRLAPKDPNHLVMWRRGTQALLSVFGIIEHAFADFDVEQIRTVDVQLFVDQWEGRRSAQTYKAHLTKFFGWCRRTGLIEHNPASDVEIEEPPKRTVVITNEQYHKIRDQLLVGEDGKATRTGPVVQVYMDLLFLLYQRGPEVRLLKWSAISDEGIVFTPTKTKRSSGKAVRIPLTDDIRAVLATARALAKRQSDYVIATEAGKPYTAHGIATLFNRARARAGITGVTLKDIRATAASMAKDSGFSEEQIKVGLAHTDLKSTRDYLRNHETPPVSEIVVKLPTRILAEPANIAPAKRGRRKGK